MSTLLLLLRHGQIRANVTRRWHGSTDSPLTWQGRRQARRTGKILHQQYDLKAVYASPLQRCQSTAHYASRHQKLDIETVDGLQEMSIGEWEDMPFRELVDRHDFINSITRDVHHTAPRGESLAGVAERVVGALRYIDARHGDGEVVLVCSHGVAMAAALAVLLHGDPARWIDYQFHNCSLTELVLSPEAVVNSYNEHSHL